MPYIKLRKQADGSVRYTAIVRIRRSGKMLHQEAKTFTHRTAAERWAKHREVALENPTALARAQQPSTKLSKLIRWYIDSFEHISKWQRSKQSQLLFLEKHPIGDVDAIFLESATLVDHVRSRRAKGAGPMTISNDLTWIGVVLRAAKSVKGLPVHPEVVDDARTACRELRLIGKSRRRERRPTPQELVKLDDYFSRRDGRARVPMRDIIWFAIHSARRESEICRIEWADNDQRGRTGLVRDAKHPRHKEGNHRRFKLTAEAWAIVVRQPKNSEYIFPYDPRSVSAAFTRACHVLGIKDLRFHDLRHEATSRLFERGYQIHEVAQFTLHESWNELKRYTNLRPEKVREIPQPASNADHLTEDVPGTNPCAA
ncbi:tyrosine-type recombinase/integrase [Steroidobacter agaridevorans]|uniref:tyrosine-type recombinase/integrase n=1 Tax=Steroidobacter agaridevorans TaxID=2695856 RepID=UPI00132A011B|nr:tyrosine-type recombinase/integrase [Steroidobacter agaridevorans]GFE87726.1 integrase [Steroidobacter agaridevorans]